MAAVLRAAFGYTFLVFIVRIAGRRPGRQMTPFEYVLIFFLGGITLTGIVADDKSLVNALCQILTVGLMHTLFLLLRSKFPRFALLMDGTPVVLLEKGQWRTRSLVKMRVQDDDVMAAAREIGLMRLDQIEYAVLERNGQINIIPREDS